MPDERPHHNHGNLTLAILSVASFPLDCVNFSQDPNHPNLTRLCQYLDQVVLPKEDKVLMAPSWWSQLRQCPGTGRPLGGWKQGGCGSLDRPPTGVPTPPTSPTHHVHQPAHKLPTMPNISAKPFLTICPNQVLKSILSRFDILNFRLVNKSVAIFSCEAGSISWIQSK